MGAGFKPYIMGGAWLKLKLPASDILVKDFDTYCPDFDPARSPVKVRRVAGGIDAYATEDMIFSIIRRVEKGTTVGQEDLDRWNEFYMVTNSFWLAAVLNKVANYVSRHPYDPFKLQDESSTIIPLVNCYVFFFSGFDFDPRHVARILSGDLFTNSRVAHLYNAPLAYAAAVIAWKYYLPSHAPEEILTRFCNEVIKPVSIELGVYDKESCKRSLE